MASYGSAPPTGSRCSGAAANRKLRLRLITASARGGVDHRCVIDSCRSSVLYRAAVPAGAAWLPRVSAVVGRRAPAAAVGAVPSAVGGETAASNCQLGVGPYSTTVSAGMTGPPGAADEARGVDGPAPRLALNYVHVGE